MALTHKVILPSVVSKPGGIYRVINCLKWNLLGSYCWLVEVVNIVSKQRFIRLLNFVDHNGGRELRDSTRTKSLVPTKPRDNDKIKTK